MEIRNATPDDYAAIISVVDAWWGGRQMAAKLPSLFFEHFRDTSFVATENGAIRGFITGFRSQSNVRQAYIHFVGIDPECRGSGLGKTLYDTFFATVKALGCDEVECVTSPLNTGSIAFHRAMGFRVLPGEQVSNGIAFTPGHDGPGGDCVRFRIKI